MIRKFGMIGTLKSDHIETYRKLHEDTVHEEKWRGVLDMIRDCHIKNYSIFIEENIVFSYFEYDGDHFEEDKKKMEQDPITQEWWKLTHPCFCMVNHDYDKEMEQIFDLSDDKL